MITWSYPFNGKMIERKYNSVGELTAEMERRADPEKPEEPGYGCWNCKEYDGEHCMKYWNNADPCYHVGWRDDKEPDDKCEDWEHDPDAEYKDFFEEE